MSIVKLTPLRSRDNGEYGDFAGTVYSQEAYCWPPVSGVEAKAVSGNGVRAQVIGSTAMRVRTHFMWWQRVDTTRVLLSHEEPEVLYGRYHHPDNSRIIEGFRATAERLDQISEPGVAAGVIATGSVADLGAPVRPSTRPYSY